jgi:transcriptional regulator with XRE-family HTH domain
MVDLREIRRALKLSQAEMADRLGLHQTTISRFERGELPLDKRTELAVVALRNEADQRAAAA